MRLRLRCSAVACAGIIVPVLMALWRGRASINCLSNHKMVRVGNVLSDTLSHRAHQNFNDLARH